MRPQAKHASYIAIKSAPDTYFLRHSYFIPRRALPLFKYHGTISCPTSVLTMPSYASMHALPTRNAVEILMQKRTDPRIDAYRTLRRFFFNPRAPLSRWNMDNISRDISVHSRAIYRSPTRTPELRLNFTLPLTPFSQPRHHLAHPPLGTAMYREQWKWLTAILNPGKASLIRHQRQNQRHRRCCNSRVNSPPCARHETAETCPLITGVFQKQLTSFYKPLSFHER